MQHCSARPTMRDYVEHEAWGPPQLLSCTLIDYHCCHATEAVPAGCRPDHRRRSGETLLVADLARLYGFTDVDGTQPEAFQLP